MREPDIETTCDLCSATLKKKSLSNHLFMIHGVKTIAAVKTSSFQCSKCEKSYGCDRSLRRHVASDHKSTSDGLVPCPVEDCSHRFTDYMSMSLHVATEHPDSVIGTVTFIDERFDSMQNFEVWKQSLRDLGSDFRIESSRSVKGNNGRVIYYRCRNSGPSKARGQTKRYGHLLRRIVDCCPAHMTAVKTEESVHVKGALFHCNHIPEPARLPLSMHDKVFVEKLVGEGILPEKIIERCKERFRENERLHYLTMKDIQSMSVNFAPGRRHRDDLNSFVIRAEEGNVADGIVHYNVSADTSTDTIIVICTPSQLEALKLHAHRGCVIDDTFNATRYVLKLTTLLVVDHSGRGIPAGFMLSHKLRTEETTVFFEVLRQLCPSMKPDFIMSDDTNVFWNGFISAFPELKMYTKKLLCRWHILQSWIRKAKSRREDGSLFIPDESDLMLGVAEETDEWKQCECERWFHSTCLLLMDKCFCGTTAESLAVG